jgi:2,3-bisphosphoglycerate-dependent phosphoglycerate mutase
MVPDLVLLRHGESTWNAENLFTGWVDVPLSERGETEAVEAGHLLHAEGLDIRVLHTSVLLRAITTAELVLREVGRSWVPVRRHWRLNERHYGGLQGLNKKETAARHGEDKVQLWRRSYDVPPPEMDRDDPGRATNDPRYRDIPPEALPLTECLADVVRRTVPYWQDAIVPDLLAEGSRGGVVLVVAHGNSIRALRKHLERIADDAIQQVEIPTGIPYLLSLDDQLEVTGGRYLGDPDAAAAAAEAVRRQSRLEPEAPTA